MVLKERLTVKTWSAPCHLALVPESGAGVSTGTFHLLVWTKPQRLTITHKRQRQHGSLLAFAASTETGEDGSANFIAIKSRSIAGQTMRGAEGRRAFDSPRARGLQALALRFACDGCAQPQAALGAGRGAPMAEGLQVLRL